MSAISLSVGNRVIEFQDNPIILNQRNIENIFFEKNNRTLAYTLLYKKYSHIDISSYSGSAEIRLGDFLKILKDKGDMSYKGFLNKYGDSKFCEFAITKFLSDRGIYCFVVENQIVYLGRCTDNFRKRINYGYGKIHPKNCFLDGQATNCNINALINSGANVAFGVHIMTDKSVDEIKQLEKLILSSNSFKWNIQKA